MERFTLQNVGTNPLFSEFQVTNPQSRTTYRVAIRGSTPGRNFCACPDFATATLGTCKHIEFTLFLGGTRLKRFLDSVEQVTTAIPPSTVEEPAPPEGQEVAAGDGDAPASTHAAPGAADPWTGLLQAGLELLGRLATPADGSGHPGHAPLPFELDLAMRRDRQRLGRPVGAGAPEFDVAPPLGVDGEPEAAKDPDQLGA